jgi:integral membrane protein
MTDPLVSLRRATFVEAVSFVLLLGAMVVKYGAQLPVGAMLVRITGSIHGALFFWLCWCLLRALTERKWPILRLAAIFVASLVPIVPFFVDRRFPGWIAASPPWRGKRGGGS